MTPNTNFGTLHDRKETIELEASDGQSLWADVREPTRLPPLGVAVLAHAMFARRSEFERPAGGGMARFLVRRGWRTLAFDFRGHGDSVPSASRGGAWTYDDLVMKDLPAVVASSRERWPLVPIVVVGHSLGGHVAMAAQGIGALAADAIVCLASNMWMRGLEPSRVRWALKRAMMALVHVACAKEGYFPARLLRLGSDDEAASYMAALQRCVRDGRWTSEDGRHDYFANLRSIAIPVYAIASVGDRLNCVPACAKRMIAPIVSPKAFDVVHRSDVGGPAPGHMELVTTDTARSAWARAFDWIEARAVRGVVV